MRGEVMLSFHRFSTFAELEKSFVKDRDGREVYALNTMAFLFHVLIIYI